MPASPGRLTHDQLKKSFMHNENQQTKEIITLLTSLSALLHDLGKACEAFQMRLSNQLFERNQFRHEWVSLRLFEAFVGDDDDSAWLARLASPTPADDATWLDRLICDGLQAPDMPLSRPFERMSHAPLAQAVSWLVVSHHRLPTFPCASDGTAGVFRSAMLSNVLAKIDAGWNERTDNGNPSNLPLYWTFRHGLPVTTGLWRSSAASVASRFIALMDQADETGNASLASPRANSPWLGNPYVMHVSRMCLMLADHHYSGLSSNAAGVPDPGRITAELGYPLFANTKKGGASNQPLDEHLIGVSQHSEEVSRTIANFHDYLPRLVNNEGLHTAATIERFLWQNEAVGVATGMRERSARAGAFVVNMASTGCGKTLANARIMNALADPEKGMRCAFAMGLRTLTLQTGRAFKSMLKLGDDELAIRVGGIANRQLFELYEREAENTGSASVQCLIDENTHVEFHNKHDDHPLLRRIVHDTQVRSLLVAPLLVCTVDHLTPATESDRGGRQIAPMLRLMSGDLVLDEPDDFDINDLPALTRLVHWAGLLGARVLLSSATLPPALVQGLFEAYRNGRHHFHSNRFHSNRADQPQGVELESQIGSPAICCAWIDEYSQSQADCTDAQGFAAGHEAFTAVRSQALADTPKPRRRRRYAYLPLSIGSDRAEQSSRFAEIARNAALDLHQSHHSTDPQTGQRVSFGLIRMANISKLVQAARDLYQCGAPDGVRIHLCTYHSQFPLLSRSRIERQLDLALNRNLPHAVFSLPDIRQRIDLHPDCEHVFIVLGSPVTEVGRDHDYDWAVVEPSSMRSLIQLAGRVRRHREGFNGIANILVFDTNLRHFQEKRRPGHHAAFCMPGFESMQFPLDTHDMKALLPMGGDESEQGFIDARPRITLPAGALQPRTRLVDLEHFRIGKMMLVQAPVISVASAGTGMGRRRASPGSSSSPNLPATQPSPINAASWWNLPPVDALLTAVLPQQQPFREDTRQRVDLVLMSDEDRDDGYKLVMLMDVKTGRRTETKFLSANEKLDRLPDECVEGPGISTWGQNDYAASLNELATELDIPLDECAKRFGTLTMPAIDHGKKWKFHPALGFTV